MTLAPPTPDGKQSAETLPTHNYNLFQMAEEQFHCSVARLLTGRDMPMGNIEYKLWMRYHAAKQRFQQQQKRSSGKGKHRR